MVAAALLWVKERPSCGRVPGARLGQAQLTLSSEGSSAHKSLCDSDPLHSALPTWLLPPGWTWISDLIQRRRTVLRVFSDPSGQWKAGQHGWLWPRLGRGSQWSPGLRHYSQAPPLCVRRLDPPCAPQPGPACSLPCPQSSTLRCQKKVSKTPREKRNWH